MPLITIICSILGRRQGRRPATSEVLDVSPPSISAQLEESLGAPLFTRTTRRLILAEPN